MKTSHMTAALLAFVMGSGAAFAAANPSPHDSDPSKINISCYRGALKTVAWDRANSVFIEDLIQLGYSYEKATVIAEHICRDEYGVRNPPHQIEQLREILRTDPPR
ncbi:MAG: hypothetical protein AAGB05_09660 [Pseudomonadota bacterium]